MVGETEMGALKLTFFKKPQWSIEAHIQTIILKQPTTLRIVSRRNGNGSSLSLKILFFSSSRGSEIENRNYI
jgi:hypothetical protein